MEEALLLPGFRIMKGTISSSKPCGRISPAAAAASWKWVNMVGNDSWAAGGGGGGLPWVCCVCGPLWASSWASGRLILLVFLEGEGTF